MGKNNNSIEGIVWTDQDLAKMRAELNVWYGDCVGEVRIGSQVYEGYYYWGEFILTSAYRDERRHE